MLNLDEFTKRLEQLFNFYELTPSTFADKIGVQRSSVSHLLSGRNKPSLDFVLKVQDSFSDLDLNWLLHGNGNMLTSAFASTPFLTESTFTNQLSDHESENEKKEEAVAQAKNETQLNEENAVSVAQAFLSETKEDFEIEKIVIFYKNGTFKSFKPEK